MNASVAPPKAGMQPSTANIQLMQLTTAYWTSRCLHVVAELGVADHVGDEPQSTESLAKATGTSAGPLLPRAPLIGLSRGIRLEGWNLASHRGITLP